MVNPIMPNLNPKTRRETLTLVGVFVCVLLVSAFGVYFLGGKTNQSEAGRDSIQQGASEATPEAAAPTRQPSPTREREDIPFLGKVLGTDTQDQARMRAESWIETLAMLTLRLIMAALLGAMLAFRPRRRVIKRNPYVAQTQILLAVVASALMIIVGDNAARAFGIFAAVSLVRFRTNIRDPKEITVLLISLAIGLATGVGRWDLAVVLTLFTLVLLRVLEKREPEQVLRSMNLKISTRDVESTRAALKNVMQRHSFESELRAVNGPKGDDQLGELVYSVDISPTVTTDELSEQILALDSQNVDGIEWEQKKSFSYAYQ
jgi:uncharacterized membrane protein YhiD involved in acid resistance